MHKTYKHKLIGGSKHTHKNNTTNNFIETIKTLIPKDIIKKTIETYNEKILIETNINAKPNNVVNNNKFLYAFIILFCLIEYKFKININNENNYKLIELLINTMQNDINKMQNNINKMHTPIFFENKKTSIINYNNNLYTVFHIENFIKTYYKDSLYNKIFDYINTHECLELVIIDKQDVKINKTELHIKYNKFKNETDTFDKFIQELNIENTIKNYIDNNALETYVKNNFEIIKISIKIPNINTDLKNKNNNKNNNNTLILPLHLPITQTLQTTTIIKDAQNILSINNQKFTELHIIYNNFFITYINEMLQSQFLNLISTYDSSKYSTLSPENKYELLNNIVIVNNKEIYTKLDNLFTILYNKIKTQQKLDIINIFSYSTGNGFIEALFAIYCKHIHNKNIVNIMYYDIHEQETELKAYAYNINTTTFTHNKKVFNNVISLYSIFNNTLNIQHDNTNIVNMFETNIEQNKKNFNTIDIFIAINAQAYQYKNIDTKTPETYRTPIINNNNNLILIYTYINLLTKNQNTQGIPMIWLYCDNTLDSSNEQKLILTMQNINKKILNNNTSDIKIQDFSISTLYKLNQIFKINNNDMIKT